MPIENKGFTALFSEKKNQLDHLQAKMASIIPAFPGQNVAKYFDLAIGVDFHSTIFPPSPLLPVPHIGMVFDIMSAIMAGIAAVLPEPPAPPPPAEGEEAVEAPITVLSVASAVVNAMKPSVKVHGQWVANAGTGIQHLPALIAHILPVVSPMASSEMWMGSSTVLADGGPCSTQFHPALSCNIVGIPSIGRKNKPPKPKMALMAPTSMLLVITSGGKPVLAGGPPTIDLFQLMFKMALKGLGKLWKKAKGKVKGPDTKNPHLGKAQPEANVKCKGEPVDVASGKVFSKNVDFHLPGPIPLVWERIYYSNAAVEGPLGYNWHHSYNMGIYDMGNGWFTVRLKDGRETALPVLVPGDAYYDRREQMLWQRDGNGYALVDDDKHIYRFEGPQNKQGFHMLSSIETMGGFSILFRYDAAGQLSEIRDSGNRRLLVEEDGAGHIARIYTVARGEEVTFIRYAYDDDGNLVETSDALNARKSFYYDDHLLVRLTNQEGMNFYWEYEGRGDEAKCIHTWGDNGILEYWFEYEEGKTTDRNSLGHISEHYYDEQLLIYKIVDGNGGVTYQSYNDFGELELMVNPEGLSIKYEHNLWGKVIKHVNENGDATLFKYDEQLNPEQVTFPGGASYKRSYDSKGRLLSRIHADGKALHYIYDGPLLKAVTDHYGRKFHFYYDEQNNLIRLDFGEKGYLAWAYDNLGRVLMATDIEGNNTLYEYDAAGNVVFIQQPDGTKHYMEYDAAGNLIHARDNNGHDVAFTYGALGILTGRRQNGSEIHFHYDTELRIRSIANEAGELYRFGHDAVGNVVSEWGFDGLQRRYVRDGAGRIIKILRPDSRWTSYVYDGTGNTISEEHNDGTATAYRYSRDGLMAEAFNEESHIYFFRDTAGRVIKEQQGAYFIERKYNADGNCEYVSSSLGAAIDLGYSADGFLNRMALQDGSELAGWSSLWQRNNSGLEVYRQLTGGVEVRTERDKLGRISLKRITNLSVEEGRNRYEWGRDNKLNKIVNELTRSSIHFEYDLLDNLARANYASGVSVDTVYKMPDKVGNLFRTPGRADRKYGKGGRLLQDDKYYYHYDAEGNLLFKEFITNVNRKAVDKTQQLEENKIIAKGSATGWLYEWAGNGTLKKAVGPAGRVVEFSYDPLGRRMAKKSNGKVTRWIWNSNVPLHEWTYAGEFPPASGVDATGKICQKEEPVDDVITWLFEEGTFVPCARIEKEHSYSIVADHLGTPTHAFDDTGKKVWERQLDCYGNLYAETGERNFIPYLYQGQYIDEETGLAYNRFRYYDPEAGLYVSQDPIGLHGGMLLYGYVKNVNGWVDVLGLSRGPVDGDYSEMMSVDGYQKHHIIADSLRDHPLLEELGYDINNNRNLVYLPESRSIDPTRTVHNGSHRKWHKEHAKAELDRIRAMDASPEVKRMHVDAYTDNMRKKYLAKEPDVQLNKHH